MSAGMFTYNFLKVLAHSTVYHVHNGKGVDPLVFWGGGKGVDPLVFWGGGKWVDPLVFWGGGKGVDPLVFWGGGKGVDPLVFWGGGYWLFCFSHSQMGPVKRICVFEHSVMTNFNCACPAIQRGQGSAFLSEGSS